MENFKAKFYGATDKGYVREINEDSYIIEKGYSKNHIKGFKLLMAVADGMGGLEKGDIISKLTVNALNKVFIPPENLNIVANEKFIEKFLILRINEINRYIYDNFNKNGEQGGTTLSILVIYEKKYIIAHVGDSRVYIIRDNNIEAITEDDSFVMNEVRKGKITLEEAKKHDKKNILLKAVGVHKEVKPTIYKGELKIGDSFVITSDGILNVIDDNEIRDYVMRYSPKDACHKLIRMANERKVDDNVTLNIVKISKKRLRGF